MDTYSLTGISRPPLILQPGEPSPRKRKSPGLAFLASLLCPGAGQLYCGRKGRGLIVASFFALSLAIVVLTDLSSEQRINLWELAFRAAIVLYAFAFLDAFFSAREINAGTDDLVDNANPRVAAVLNLLTKGFGYFYLGERGKGVLVFLGLSVVQALTRDVMALAILVELVLVGLAAHAYVLARNQLRELPEYEATRGVPITAQSGLSPVVPVSLAGLFAVNYVLLIVIGLLMGNLDKLAEGRPVLHLEGEHRIYRHENSGIVLPLLPDWEPMEEHAAEVGSTMTVARFEGACTLHVFAEASLPFSGLEAYTEELRQTVLADDVGFVVAGTRQTSLGTLPAREVSFISKNEEGEAILRYAFARQGLVLYTLVVSIAAGYEEECFGEAETMRTGLLLPR